MMNNSCSRASQPLSSPSLNNQTGSNGFSMKNLFVPPVKDRIIPAWNNIQQRRLGTWKLDWEALTCENSSTLLLLFIWLFFSSWDIALSISRAFATPSKLYRRLNSKAVIQFFQFDYVVYNKTSSGTFCKTHRAVCLLGLIKVASVCLFGFACCHFSQIFQYDLPRHPFSYWSIFSHWSIQVLSRFEMMMMMEMLV